MQVSDCIVLAGGMGTRLQSVVSDKPKCLAEIQGQPFLAYLLKQLSRYTIGKVVLAVGYKKECVIEFIEQHKNEYPFQFEFSTEDEPLGTGGAIIKALEKCNTQDVFVVNGDTFFDVDLDKMLAFQQSRMADTTLALKPMQHADRYGLVHINDENIITGFEEKKTGASGLINGGVYCLFKPALLTIPFEQKFSFEKEYLETFLNERQIAGYIEDKYFIDIGIPEDYAKAQNELPDLV